MSHVAEADNPVRHRYAVLAPYLERVELVRSGKLNASLELDSWESRVVDIALGESCEAEVGDADDWPSLVVEGIAFMDKAAEDMSLLETSEAIPAETVTTLHARLMTDGAIGLALMEELQRAVDTLVVMGRIDDAKKLTGFRNRIGHPVSRIKETVGPVAHQAAERLATRMVPDQQALRRVVAKPDARVARPAQQTFARRASASAQPARAEMSFEKTPNRTKPMLMILGVLIIVWAVFILPLLNRPELPILTQEQIPESEAIRAVAARPPSLFVELDARAWNRMSDAERRQLIADVGQVAQASGYTGALFREADGSSRAQWLKQRGVLLAPSAR